MKRYLLIIFIFCGGVATLAAQQKNNAADFKTDKLERRGLEFGLGLYAPSFQDTRFSEVQYAGFGGGAAIGLRKRTKGVERWAGLTVGYAKMGTSVNELASHKRINASLAYEQQRFIGELLGGQWLVGGEVRANLDIFTSGAGGNNGKRSFSNVGLTALSTVRLNVKDNPLSLGVGLGLLHWGKDNNSFAFSMAQHLLEGGEFGYEGQDAKAEPFAGHQFLTLGAINQFRTRVGYQFGRKLAVQYDWELTRYAVVKGYPTTQAGHTLGLRITL